MEESLDGIVGAGAADADGFCLRISVLKRLQAWGGVPLPRRDLQREEFLSPLNDEIDFFIPLRPIEDAFPGIEEGRADGILH